MVASILTSTEIADCDKPIGTADDKPISKAMISDKLVNMVGVNDNLWGAGRHSTSQNQEPTRLSKAFLLLPDKKKAIRSVDPVINSRLYCADNHSTYKQRQFLFDIIIVMGKCNYGVNYAFNGSRLVAEVGNSCGVEINKQGNRIKANTFSN
jgi:hypothetical protein